MPSWLVGSSTDHREPLVFFELGGGHLRGIGVDTFIDIKTSFLLLPA